MNFPAVNSKYPHATIVNLLYTVWVEGLPSTLPSSHRPNLAPSKWGKSLDGRFLRDRFFGSTSNVFFHYFDATWLDIGGQLGSMLELFRFLCLLKAVLILKSFWERFFFDFGPPWKIENQRFVL